MRATSFSIVPLWQSRQIEGQKNPSPADNPVPRIEDRFKSSRSGAKITGIAAINAGLPRAAWPIKNGVDRKNGGAGHKGDQAGNPLL